MLKNKKFLGAVSSALAGAAAAKKTTESPAADFTETKPSAETTEMKTGTSANTGASSVLGTALGIGGLYAPVYTESETVSAAKKALAALQNKKPTYTSRYQSDIEDVLGKIENREPFSYDINADALYDQYKDQYIKNGNLAMLDVMGQAQAMTGGYANSYAQTVGNEAYLAYLAELNSIIPELNERAYQRYQDEGDALYQQYALLAEQEGIDYDRYMNELSLYLDERNYLADRLEAERDFDYQQYLKDYDAYRDQAADHKWQTEYDEDVNRYEDSKTGNVALDESGGGNVNVSDEIVSRLESAADNHELADYLDRLAENGTITEETADSLFVQYRQPEQAPLSERQWTLAEDGGMNWFGGIDNNAVVRDQYGNQYRLDKLVDALTAEGMDKSDAKEYVKALQKRIGA